MAVSDVAGQSGDALCDGDLDGFAGEGEEAVDDGAADLGGQLFIAAEKDLEEVGAADDALEGAVGVETGRRLMRRSAMRRAA